jgi:carboxylesterase
MPRGSGRWPNEPVGPRRATIEVLELMMSSMSTSNASIVDRSTFHKGGRTGLLLIHGLGGSPVEVRFIAQGLARAGFTVLCPQLAGHCGTPDDLSKSTWREWYASIEAAHDRLSRECDVVIAGGLSTGALLALELAHNRPGQVHGLTLFSPSIYLDGWAMPWYMPWLHYLRPSPLKIDIKLRERSPYGLKDERVRALAVRGMQDGNSKETGFFFTPLRTMMNFNSLAAKVRAKLGRIGTPTLVLHPREDDVASLANAMEIQRKMAGPVDLVVLEDSYHMITLDKQRHLVVDRTAAFAHSVERRQAELARPAAAAPVQVRGSRRLLGRSSG